MAGLGTYFVLLMMVSAFLLWRGKLYTARWILWALLLSFPLPYIANTAGWMTAELGRQPWLIYGLMRTSEGFSNNVSASNGLFTLLGFMGLYAVISVLFLVLVYREIAHGPQRRCGYELPKHSRSAKGKVRQMGFIWFWLVAVMIVGYVVLDGFDLGVGVLHLFLVRNEAERQTTLRSIGPVWDGNEVWLLAGGGTLYFAFPLLYASAFSGFYLPLMIVLWLLILRGVSLELRNHIDVGVWRALLDGVFGLSSALLTIFFGAALANVIRGVPLGDGSYFFLPLWTNWQPGPNPGILDWYTVIGGLVALVALTMHGALWLTIKTEGGLQQRARATVRILWFALLLLTIGSLVATISVRPSSLHNYYAHPIIFAVPVLVAACLGGHSLLQPARQGSGSIPLLGWISGLHDGGCGGGIVPRRSAVNQRSKSRHHRRQGAFGPTHSSRGTGVVGIWHADGVWLFHPRL